MKSQINKTIIKLLESNDRNDWIIARELFLNEHWKYIYINGYNISDGYYLLMKENIRTLLEHFDLSRGYFAIQSLFFNFSKEEVEKLKNERENIEITEQ